LKASKFDVFVCLSIFAVLINHECAVAYSTVRHKAPLQLEHANDRGARADKRSGVETITLEFQADNVIKLFDRDRKFGLIGIIYWLHTYLHSCRDAFPFHSMIYSQTPNGGITGCHRAIYIQYCSLSHAARMRNRRMPSCRVDNGELNRDELQDFLDTFTMVEEVPPPVSPLSMEIMDHF
jgi:hypothetical protein